MATQTVEQVARLAPFQEEFLKDVFAQAKALQDTPQPFAEQQVAGLAGGQQAAIAAAMAGIGGYQPFLRRAAQFSDPSGVSQFFDPFQEQVVQQTLADIGEQGQIAQRQLGAQGVASGAFGGSRFGLAQSDLARRTLEQQARSAGQLRSAGFQQAQQAAQRAAQLQGALGQTAQQLGVQDINTLLGIGSLQQQQGQRELDATRANLLAQQALPFQQVGFMSDIFRGVPQLMGSQTTTPQQNPNLLTTGVGLLGAGLSGGFFNR